MKRIVVVALILAASLSKETFQASLFHYKELVNDMYFHVLAQVDEYNKLVRESEEVYVGVKAANRTRPALGAYKQTG
jgi:hypothetical protein